MISPEAHSEPVKMKCFAKIVNDLTIFAKHSILDVWEGSEYASDTGTFKNYFKVMAY